MSIEGVSDEERAEVSLRALAGLECADEGGPIDLNGHCAFEEHAHCPFCGDSAECTHEVAGWDDSLGYRGPRFPESPETDDPVWNATEAQVGMLLGSLAPLWETYRESGDYGVEEDVLLRVIELMDLPGQLVGWQRNSTPGDGSGVSYFALEAAEVTRVLDDVSERLTAALAAIREGLQLTETAGGHDASGI